MPQLFRKTAKGQAEIETRAHRLTPRLRGLLILVDGKRDLDALAALVAQHAAALLEELTSQGFIETFEAAGAPAAARATAAATPAAAASAGAASSAGAGAGAGDFEQLRRDAVRAVTDLLGPAAETVAMRMEKAKSPEELSPLLAQAAQAVANMRGRAAAEAYAAKFPAA